MIKKYPNILIVIVLFFSCGQEPQPYVPEGLYKVTKAEMLENYRASVFPNLDSIIYKNHIGEIISRDSLVKIEPFDSLAFDDYMDDSGVVKVVIVRTASEEDKAFMKKCIQVQKDGPILNHVEIDCDDLGSALEDIYESDQKNRESGAKYDRWVDIRNTEFIVNLLEQCGMPTKNELSSHQIKTIWLVIQHSQLKYQKKYISVFIEAAKKGDLSRGNVALMEDRILLREGKPQIYGSQIKKNAMGEFVLNETIELEYLNQRRKQVGLNPIEDYLLNWDIEFDIEQKDTIH